MVAHAQIKLSTKSYGQDAAEEASEAIENVSKSLVDADMSDVIAGRPEAEALNALRIMSCALSRLQLRYLAAHASFVCGALSLLFDPCTMCVLCISPIACICFRCRKPK